MEQSSGFVSRPSGFNRMFNRSQHSSTGSDTSDTTGSPSPTKKPSTSFGKFDRKSSEPSFTQIEATEKEGKQKKRRSLFKKKPHSNASSSYVALTDDFQRSPILASKHNSGGRKEAAAKPSIPELDEEMQPPARPPITQSATVPGRLFRPKSSPRLVARGLKSGGRGGGDENMKSLPSPLQKKMVDSGGTSGDVGKAKGKPGGRRPPPPPPPPYAKRYGNKGLQSLVMRHNSTSEGGGIGEEADDNERAQALPSHERLSSSGKYDNVKAEEDDGLIMTVTPASPVFSQEPSPVGGWGRKDEEGGTRAREESGEDCILPPMSSTCSNSMEDLFKNLEEFDELSSNQSLNNGHLQGQKDYATIPQSELLQPKNQGGEGGGEVDEVLPRSASVPASSFTPPMMEDRPCLTPSPLGTVSEAASTTKQKPPLSRDSSSSSASSSSSVPPPTSSSSSAPPVKPPRSRSKRMKTKKLMEEDDHEQEVATAPPQAAPPPTWQQGSPKLASSPQLKGRPVFHKPKPPPNPPSPYQSENLSERQTKESKPTPGTGGMGGVQVKGSHSPIAPPRRKPRTATPDDGGSGKPALRPKPPQMSRMQVDVMLKKQTECSSAPVSRTSSPDVANDPQHVGRLRQESSTSSTNLASSKTAVKRTHSSELVDSEADNCTVSRSGGVCIH